MIRLLSLVISDLGFVFPGAFLSTDQRHQHHARQDADDRDRDQELDQGKSTRRLAWGSEGRGAAIALAL